MPVGAPHLGAQKCIRAMIDGDRMGLDAFLEKEEGLMLGRSLGSAPWLFPLESFDGATPPKSEALPQSPPLPVVVVRQESAIRISIPAQCLQLKSFVHNRKRLVRFFNENNSHCFSFNNMLLTIVALICFSTAAL